MRVSCSLREATSASRMWTLRLVSSSFSLSFLISGFMLPGFLFSVCGEDLSEDMVFSFRMVRLEGKWEWRGVILFEGWGECVKSEIFG